MCLILISTQNELKMKKLLLFSFFFALFIKINAQKEIEAIGVGKGTVYAAAKWDVLNESNIL